MPERRLCAQDAHSGGRNVNIVTNARCAFTVLLQPHPALRHLFKLAVVQLGIETVLCQQTGMSSALYDIAIFHYKYHVGVLYRGEPVRYDKRCPALRQLVHCRLYDTLGPRIHGARSFV